MAKKIKLELTPLELELLMDGIDNLSSMVGVGSDFDHITKRMVKNLDKMLIRNGYKRKYN